MNENEKNKAASRQNVIDFFGNKECLLKLNDSTTYEIYEKEPSLPLLKHVCSNTKKLGTIMLHQEKDIITINIEKIGFYDTIKEEWCILKALCPNYKLTLNYTPRQ